MKFKGLKKLKPAIVGQTSPTEVADKASLEALKRRAMFTLGPSDFVIDDASLSDGRVTLKLSRNTPTTETICAMTFDETGCGEVRFGIKRKADGAMILTLLKPTHEDKVMLVAKDFITVIYPLVTAA